MDTFVRVKGMLKKPRYKRGPWYLLWPVEIETYKSMSFSVEHENETQLFQVIDKVLTDVIRNQGITVVGDENKVSKDPNNMQFWPMDNFSHIRVETKLLSAPPVQGPIQ